MRRLISSLAIAGMVGLATASAAFATNFGWTFTYQGRLNQSGSAVNGPLPMKFRLFAVAVGGSPLGPELSQLVDLSDGLFTANLDFTAGGTIGGVFDGNDRWLEIEVNGTTLTPRQKLNATPHAAVASLFAVPLAMETTSPTIMHLISDANVAQVRAFMVETNSTEIGAEAIVGVHNDPTNEGVGVTGTSYSGNGYGVVGSNMAPGGNNSGVYGLSISPSGAGVFAYGASTSGTNYGIYGKTDSPQGYAGYFDGRGYFSSPVGIGPGAANPAFQLDVRDTIGNLVIGAESNSPIGSWLGLKNTAAGGGNWAIISTASGNSEGGNKLLFHNAATVTTRMTIANDFVGVGRSNAITAAEEFGVESNAGNGSFGGMYVDTQGAGGLPFYGYATAGAARAWHYYDGSTDQWALHLGTDRLVVNGSDGRVGIGTNAPSFLLHVNGSAGKPGGGSWSVASDIRLKKNVETIHGALDSLMAIRGVTFEYIDPKAIDELPGTRLGVVAQEVEKVFPDWVDDSADGFKRVTFRGFEGVAIEALRDLRAEKDAQIDALRHELDAKSAEVESLKARLDRIEAALGAASQKGGAR
ncbi:MAG: tail fiber domain-containing protein [Phycisphaerales bacterium]